MTIIEQVRVLYPKNGNPDASKEEIGGLMLNLMPDEAVGKGWLQEDLQFTKSNNTGMGTMQQDVSIMVKDMMI